MNLQAFEKKYTAYDRFYGNGPYGEISTKEEPIISHILHILKEAVDPQTTLTML